MRVNTLSSIALLGTIAAVFVPLGARGAGAPPASSVITVTATRATGAEAVTIAGNAPAAQPLEATLYAHFSVDVPTVVLSRRSVVADANGHYAATISLASAYFRNAIVTVVVKSLPAGPSARAQIRVAAPNDPAPPDDVPYTDR